MSRISKRLCGAARSLARGVGLLSLALVPALAIAVEAPDEIDSAESCVNGECHGAFTRYGFLHWPDLRDAGQCQECHQADGNDHAFETEDSSESCLRCHEALDEKISAAENTHDALEDGCIDCHDPHGGAVKALLVGVEDEDIRPICFECHEDEILAEEVKHGPADLGACNGCHDPHASDVESLLLGEGLDLCGECHEEVAEIIQESEYVHGPVEDGCLDCHMPHSAPNPKLLVAEKRQLCNECHDDIVDIAEGSKVDHAPTFTDDECVGCHDPHASNHAPNLRKPQRELCLDCHNKPVKSGDAMLLDMQAWLTENREWHEPIVEGDCSGCHQPHGGENFRLLVEPYPQRFYASFDLDVYALCFSCHESDRVTQERTRKATGFRDGSRNLHFLHVNREKRGRSCRACHEVHASPLPLHLREFVPYGKWMMPLNYEKTETGGSCHPGCHEAYSYDRDAQDDPVRR